MCLSAGVNPMTSLSDTQTGAGAIARCCPPPNWMPIALAELARDVREIAGPANHPDIVKYFGMNRYGFTSDSGTSWCGSFVAWVLNQAGYGLSTVPERALTWGRAGSHAEGWWPDGVNAGRPIYGAIAVKSRSGGGHVTFVMGSKPDDPTKLMCLGGNQNNRLNVAEYSMGVFSSYMVPRGYAHECCVLPVYSGESELAGTEA